jgi:mono/diheme cytochrome c family protein
MSHPLCSALARCLLCAGVLLVSQQLFAQTIVPAYARFRNTDSDPATMGRLLISELNCRACHASAGEESLEARQAPILTAIHNRTSSDFVRRFITDPQHVKPGTAMPGFETLTGDSNQQNVEALTAFLMHDGVHHPTGITAAGVRRGGTLFHTVGCAACHGDLRVSPDQRPPFAMPIGTPEDKYTVDSLADFLGNPHSVRPSGRMPSLNLLPEEARDIANYLMKDMDASTVESHLDYEVFEGSFETLPDFTQLTPTETGATSEFDIQVSGRKDLFALRFMGYLQLPQDAEYRFWLKSDDGSRLIIDDQTVIDNDGVHPEQERNEARKLTAGPHRIVVEFFEFHGGEFLSAEIAGGGISRQSAANVITRTMAVPIPNVKGTRFSPELVQRGGTLFRTLGCAACHQYGSDDQHAERTKTAPPFETMNTEKGCLSGTPLEGVPQFVLSDQQVFDIRAALGAMDVPDTESNEDQIIHAMAVLNCFACHQRNSLGGVPSSLNALFTGSVPEMGDEGRIPPSLDGVGDKLNPQWLRHILNEGAKDRSYMATRMPKFGARQTGNLADLLAATDRQPDVPAVSFDEPIHRVKADARLMIGDQALSCIKCHSFGKYRATGIQAMNLTTMTKRLRRDWFHRYLLNPQAYRPGTRMPAAWPNGRSVVPHILSKTPAIQIEAMWDYLGDGEKAKIPSGLVAEAIELKPIDRPIIYRNFIAGLSPRGIAVGFPEHAHFGWDARHMTVRLIWHNAFIDASKHWIGRGPGNQSPLGDHVMTLPEGPAVGSLDSLKTPWPTISDVADDLRFLGYRLDSAGRPAFRYRWNDSNVTDTIVPVTTERDAGFRRTMTFTQLPTDQLTYVRVAAGSVQKTAGSWSIDQAVQLSDFSTTPVLRDVDGRQELLVPVHSSPDHTAEIRYLMHW